MKQMSFHKVENMKRKSLLWTRNKNSCIYLCIYSLISWCESSLFCFCFVFIIVIIITWNTLLVAAESSIRSLAKCYKQRILATNECCSNHTGSDTVWMTGGEVFQQQKQLRQFVFNKCKEERERQQPFLFLPCWNIDSLFLLDLLPPWYGNAFTRI